MADEYFPPLNPKEFEQKIKPREALSNRPSVLTRRFFVSTSKEPPKIETQIVRVEGARSGQDVYHYEIVLEIDGVRLGERTYPPPILQ